MKHLFDLLVRASDRWPDHVHHCLDGAPRTFASLLDDARRCAGGVVGAGWSVGQPVLVLVERPHDFYPVYWGMIQAGVIPVPLAGPRSSSPEEIGRVMRVHRQLGGPVVVDRGVSLPGVETTDVSTLLNGEPLDHVRSGIDIAMIQFSSGSTGDPCGVVLTHARVLANVWQLCDRMPVTDTDRLVTWMPHHHDMGLVGCHLYPLAAGMEQVVMPSISVVADPVELLRTADRHDATVVTTTNFLLVRILARLSAPHPLPKLRLLVNGAEPIEPAVCRAFSSRIGKSTDVHYPMYGLAEATVGVACSASPGLRTTTVGGREVTVIGPPLDHIDVRLDQQDDEGVGRLFVRGPNIFSSYYENPARTRQTSKEGWLDTGDLAVLRDGELAIVGRTKSVICVGGRNIHAHDVERVVEAVSGVRSGGSAALCDRRSQTEGLAVCVRTTEVDAAPVLWAVRRAVRDQIGVEPTDVVPVDRIPRTTSGKKRRASLAAALAAGALDDNVGNTLELVRHVWSEVLGRPLTDDDVDTPFRALGGSSVSAVHLLERLSSRFGVTPDHRLLLNGETVRKLALLLERRPPAETHDHAHSRRQDVAIIGATCRLPGADSLLALSERVTRGTTQIGPSPPRLGLDTPLIGGW
ncbi:MAG: acyl-CoA synthetase (AMP-forming)/AMP-acid ligase II/acyl carrier protein, partial [Kiritimatiellia bacterium]